MVENPGVQGPPPQVLPAPMPLDGGPPPAPCCGGGVPPTAAPFSAAFMSMEASMEQSQSYSCGGIPQEMPCGCDGPQGFPGCNPMPCGASPCGGGQGNMIQQLINMLAQLLGIGQQPGGGQGMPFGGGGGLPFFGGGGMPFGGGGFQAQQSQRFSLSAAMAMITGGGQPPAGPAQTVEPPLAPVPVPEILPPPQ